RDAAQPARLPGLAGDQMTGAGPAVILVGPPGSGKSTVGPLLAARLRTGFLDTDDEVEAIAHKPVGEIFVEDGETAFRALGRPGVEGARRRAAGRSPGRGAGWWPSSSRPARRPRTPRWRPGCGPGSPRPASAAPTASAGSAAGRPATWPGSSRPHGCAGSGWCT